MKGGNVNSLPMEPSAVQALKRYQRTDQQSADRLRSLIRKASAETLAPGAFPVVNQHMAKLYGGVIYKLRSGDLRLLYVPGKIIITLGHRKEIYKSYPWIE